MVHMPESRFLTRLKAVLALGDGPIPGDRVRINSRARNPHSRGRIGNVREIATIAVEVDGRVTFVNPASVDIL